jgi:hypothetical protein
MRIGAVGVEYPLKSLGLGLADHQDSVLVDYSHDHCVLPLLAAMGLLLKKPFMLMWKGGKAFAWQNEDRDRRLVHAAGQVRGRLSALELRSVLSCDKALVLGGRELRQVGRRREPEMIPAPEHGSDKYGSTCGNLCKPAPPRRGALSQAATREDLVPQVGPWR